MCGAGKALDMTRELIASETCCLSSTTLSPRLESIVTWDRWGRVRKEGRPSDK